MGARVAMKCLAFRLGYLAPRIYLIVCAVKFGVNMTQLVLMFAECEMGIVLDECFGQFFSSSKGPHLC